MHEGILEKLGQLVEFIECFKQLNCDESSLAQLSKVISQVENRMNRLKHLLELNGSNQVLEHEVK